MKTNDESRLQREFEKWWEKEGRSLQNANDGEKVKKVLASIAWHKGATAAITLIGNPPENEEPLSVDQVHNLLLIGVELEEKNEQELTNQP